MKVVAGIVVVLAAIAAYAHWPITPLPQGAKADRVVIVKHERSLSLMSGGDVLKNYSVSLGGNPVGAKTQEGDRKTPEGLYRIDYRKPDSAFHRALHVSYPSEKDKSHAASLGVNPGGLIMIHGIRNGLGMIGRWHRLVDWTNGCIAATDAEIEQIWSAVPDGTPVEIRP